MAKIHHKLIVTILVIFIGAGALAEAASNVETCLPKACCCVNAASSQPHGHTLMEMPLGCTPQEPAPCCKAKPFRPEAQLAISWTPNMVAYKLFAAPGIPASTCQNPVYLTRFNPYFGDGPSKIPLVAIYLQTQTLLC